MLFSAICKPCRYPLHISFYFSDLIRPIRTLWLVGEGFFCASLSALQNLKTGGIASNWPYLYQQFQIKPLYQQSSGNAVGTLHKLYNSVVKGLNGDNRLPDYIFLFPDRDIILELNYFKPGKFSVLQELVDWLGKEIHIALAGRSEKLQQAAPGSVIQEPMLVWIPMIRRPLINNHPYPTYNLVCQMHTTFNDMLENEAKKSCYALMANADRTTQTFDNFGNLTPIGKGLTVEC